MGEPAAFEYWLSQLKGAQTPDIGKKQRAQTRKKMAVQGVTRLQAKIRSKQQRAELIAGARDDFLAICRRLDEGAPPEIAARPRWPGPGLCAPTFAPLVPPQQIAWSPPPSPDRPLAAPRSPARPPRSPDAARVAGADDADAARLAGAAAALTSSPESPASSLEPARARAAAAAAPIAAGLAFRTARGGRVRGRAPARARLGDGGAPEPARLPRGRRPGKA